MADAAGGDRIGRVVAHHCIEQTCRVGHVAAHRPERAVDRRPAGIDAAPAHQPGGRAHPDHAVPRRRPPDRGEPLLADGDRRQVGGDRGARPAGRAAGGAGEVVDVARRAEQRAMGVARAHLAQRRLGEENRAGRPEARCDKAIAPRKMALEQDRSHRRRHAVDIGLVLHDHRDAVQRAGRAGLLEGRVEARGLVQRVGVQRDDRIERRAVPVIGLDPLEIGFDQRPRRQRSRAIGRVDVRDGGFRNREPAIRRHVVPPAPQPISGRISSAICAIWSMSKR